MVDRPRYKAFITYSHRDEKWARWLQRSLEGYRVPRRLVGSEGAYGHITDRLRPVFRDREDLSSSADLSARIKEELSNSETLVVICSPAAAASRWVNEEIRFFRQLGRSDRIVPLIVDGDPGALEGSGACFPPAALESPEPGRHEPLAADVRRYADGKRLALLKTIAGILGIRLDELRQRDAQRRKRRLVLLGTAALLLVSVIGWLLWSQVTTRAAAEVQRANTEELLRYMLGRLDTLDPIPGLERISPADEAQQQRRAQLGLAGLDDAGLMERMLGWREAGKNLQWQGLTEDALVQFTNSRAAAIELYQRAETAEQLFELGQAEYYVGEAYIELGELDRAQQHWSQYGAVTRRLLNSEPENPRYVMELSYTLMNLGALEQQRPVPDRSKSLELLRAAVEFNQMALVLDPGNAEYSDSLINELEWLADAWMEGCDLGHGHEVRRQTVKLRREALAEQPHDATRQKDLALALTGLATVQRQIGLNQAAVASFEDAIGILKGLQRAEPGNGEIEWEALYREVRLARLLTATGELPRASSIIEGNALRIAELASQDVGRDHLLSVEAAFFGLDRARLMLALGDNERGQRKLRAATERMGDLVAANPGFRESLQGLALASFLYWQEFGEKPAETLRTLLQDYVSGTDPMENCADADLRARLSIMDGDRIAAERLTGYVLGRGYFDADFVSFCRRYATCDLP